MTIDITGSGNLMDTDLNDQDEGPSLLDAILDDGLLSWRLEQRTIFMP